MTKHCDIMDVELQQEGVELTGHYKWYNSEDDEVGIRRRVEQTVVNVHEGRDLLLQDLRGTATSTLGCGDMRGPYEFNRRLCGYLLFF